MSCSPSTTTTITSPAVSSRTIGFASIRRETIPNVHTDRYGCLPMPDRLRAYREKRDFGAPPEPGAEAAAELDADELPRYVVQEHHARALHWDLRLEHEGTRASWA